MSLTLYFLRFSLGINAALAAFWLAGTVVPFLISPPATFSWSYFSAYPVASLLQGYGLHNTFLLYGSWVAICTTHTQMPYVCVCDTHCLLCMHSSAGFQYARSAAST